MSSESGFVSPLHQQSSNKSGQSIRYVKIQYYISIMLSQDNNTGVKVTFYLLFDSFCEYDHDRWGQLVSQARMEVLAAPEMDVNADKGFNFSPSDNNFIVQKKNHFQVY